MKHSFLRRIRHPLRAAAGLAVLGAATLAGAPARGADGIAQAAPLSGSSYVITLSPSYTPQGDPPVGTILQDKEGAFVQTIILTRVRTCTVQKRMRVNGTLVPGMEKTYRTNVAGIGVRFYTTRGWAGGWELGPVDTNYYVPPSSRTTWRAAAELVVTGPVEGGTLITLPSLYVTMSDCYNNFLPFDITIAPGARIVSGTCLVTTPSVAVTLPPVNTRDFAGVGSTRGDTNLRIGLDCKRSADVYVTLTDATNPGNRGNLLTPAAGSTAEGVQLRLLHDGVPVAYGPDSAAAGNPNQWRLGATGSVAEVPLTAQYVATGTVKPGVVKGIATFTLSYQ
ncbi:fimbrial protein [Pigmentiphaga sp. YJ18]|uniref:fimbrial protein n=1 Tax=Pigmentiphaga sp. YJ18 TaxID=3134907 RepID=UPI0031117365